MEIAPFCMHQKQRNECDICRILEWDVRIYYHFEDLKIGLNELAGNDWLIKNIFFQPLPPGDMNPHGDRSYFFVVAQKGKKTDDWVESLRRD